MGLAAMATVIEHGLQCDAIALLAAQRAPPTRQEIRS
jgi:hypothetical protein